MSSPVPRRAPRLVEHGTGKKCRARVPSGEASAILHEVEYVELSGRSDFNDLFVDQLAFPG